MINRILSLFQGMDEAEAKPAGGGHDKQLAAAALLVEAAALDGEFDAEERTTIGRLLADHFSLNETETGSLLDEAVAEQSDANHLLRFTRAIKDTYPLEEREQILEMLWEVVYADGVLHQYEANLLRRVSGLLYVSDRESGAARKRVLTRLGLDEPPASEG